MDITKAVQKLLENSLRRFAAGLTRPQFKGIKSLTRGIIRKTTTVLSALNEEAITNCKYREKISYHLGNIDIIDAVEEKGYACAKKTKDFKGYMIASYDEGDIFKPESKKIEGLKWIRD